MEQMINPWEVMLDGYKAPIVRKVAGDIQKKADIEVGKSRRYNKKKLEYWAKGGARFNCTDIVAKAFTDEKLSAAEIVEKYGFTYNYVRRVLVDRELVEAGTRHGKKPVVIIHESGKIKHYDSVDQAMHVFGLKHSSFTRHLQKKGNVDYRNGMKAMYKSDYDALGRKP
jgi:hypothetical protein